MPDRRSRHLVAAADRLRGQAAAVLPRAPATTAEIEDPEAAAELVRAVLDDALEAVAAPADPAAGREAAALLERAEVLEGRLLQAAHDEAAFRDDALGDGFAVLRSCATAADLVDRVCPLALRVCGATRALSSIVHDGAWTPLRVSPDDPGGAPLRPRRAGTVELAGLAVERAVIERDRTLLSGARGDVEEAPTQAPCVVVPLPVDGRVRGLLHLEFEGREIDDEDLRVADRYGRAVGLVYEVLDTFDRLDDLDRTIEGLRATLGSRADEDAGAELAGSVPRRAPAVRSDDDPPGADLTPRQRETLELMLLGLSNAAIAERLVVGVPTVKSHVSAILRAVGAVNRAEAIGRYLERRET